ncbi:Dynein regulatory complex subunit 7 like protein [Argiope bruennichi]|uniref:Dynein regulatory complex subunit 7 like protein n=1 Tax=Argiope bruennichi TaxID=94029 RepID=A0A8T0E1T3_ARGBR|nr:Dynein regulatory complex subunit 7 like protein [Argiope bruennichi]
MMKKIRQQKTEPLPTSYIENNQKEKEILYLAENYQRQFQYLYPDRIEPTLYLENECKINKLLCTTLCPIKITKTTELREWNDCAIFLADYVEYIPLKIPTRCPQTLFSLDSILKKRKGNSLEMSMILCTLLLSSDYDAYVVQGYATKQVTKKIEKEKADPIFTLPKKFRRYEEFFTQRPQPVVTEKNKYNLDFEKARLFWLEGKVFEESEEMKKKTTTKERQRDILYGKRVHFWVLLKSSENGTTQPVFLEASTGETISIDNPEYLGIEFVWNDRNFWSNNENWNGSCKDIIFDFEDFTKWEVFLPEYKIQETESGSSTMQIRMPETWIRDIEITQKDVENRFPPDGKHTRYKTSKVDKYNPHTLRDGLVCRIIYYNNEDLSDPIKSHSFYSDRNDSLEYRVLDIKGNTVLEMFAQNREDALKSHEYHINNDPHYFQTMEFYSYLRSDRLSVRKWTEETAIDYFINRSDFLSTRQVMYQNRSKSEGPPDQPQTQIHERSREKIDLKDEDEKQIKEVDLEVKDGKETKEDDLEVKDGKETKEDDLEVKDGKETKEDDLEVKDGKETKEDDLVGESEKQIKTEDDDANVSKSQTDIKETEHSKTWSFNPSSFDSNEPILENIDLSIWNFTEFLQSIDPAERYATSESESEDDDAKLTKKGHKHDAKERMLQRKLEVDSGESNDKKDSGITKETSKVDAGDDSDEKKPSVPESDDEGDNDSTIQRGKTEEKDAETEEEIDTEIYDDINFDALSDEELEIDYQTYLSNIWKEYSNSQCSSLFYIDKEYQNRKDMNKKKVLVAKKRVIKKRRINIRYLERKEAGKPLVRHYKKKSEEQLEQGKYTDALIKHLHLKAKLDIPETPYLKEFHVVNLDEDHINAAEAEVIKKESMKLLDRSLKVAAETEALISGKRILSIKHTYLNDSSSPLENSIQNIWFLFENNSYRIDFHRPEGRSTCRSIIFTKPESASTEFTFSDYLCRQIIPVYEKRKITRPRLYSYLASLIKKESLVLRENTVFENDMKQLLAKRAKEMRVASSFQERSGWKIAAQDVLEAKHM